LLSCCQSSFQETVQPEIDAFSRGCFSLFPLKFRCSARANFWLPRPTGVRYSCRCSPAIP